MVVTFTVTQKERLGELGVPPEMADSTFEDNNQRNESYRKLEKESWIFMN